MTVVFRPSEPKGSVAAPPSKSMAHRALICAGLARGESVIRSVAPSEDILATMDCLRALGAEVEPEGTSVKLRGADPFSPPENAVLPCRESGSTLRFLIPVCLLSSRNITMTGSERLLRRPLSVYRELCAARGLSLERGGAGLRLQGPIAPGEYRVPGDISSQFVSGLLFALPLLEAESVIRLLPPVESRPYIDMTLAVLRAFGVRAVWTEPDVLSVPGGQRYAPGDAAVEGDWSNAAFFLAMGLRVTGLDPHSLQGDRRCAEDFRALDAGRAELDLAACPDLGPVLFAYAALRHGGVFTGTRRLRDKESDRVEAMRQELEKFGVPVTAEANRVTVGCGLRAPAAPLYGHNDHRIIMALSLLCLRTGGSIRGAEAVRKSFPDFFARLRETGAELEEINNGMDQ